MPFSLFSIGLWVASAVVLLDQASKAWILERVMLPPRVIEVTSFFNLVLTWNRGVSFGLFNTDSPLNAWLLPVVALVILCFLFFWLTRAKALILSIGLGLIIGGAVGNLADRLRFGAVADFLDFHVMGFHWPAFNVADAAITVGVVILIVDSLFGSAVAEREAAAKMGKEPGK